MIRGQMPEHFAPSLVFKDEVERGLIAASATFVWYTTRVARPRNSIFLVPGVAKTTALALYSEQVRRARLLPRLLTDIPSRFKKHEV